MRIGISPSGPGIRRFSMERTGSSVPAAGFNPSAAALRASTGDKDSNGGAPSAWMASRRSRTVGWRFGLSLLRVLMGVDDIVFEIYRFRGGGVIARVGMPVLRVPPGGVDVPVTGARVGPSEVGQRFLLLAIESILHFARWLHGADAAALHFRQGLNNIFALAFQHECDRIVAQVSVRAVLHKEVGKTGDGEAEI